MRIVILGAGVMGTRLARHFARAGYSVAVIDPSAPSRAKSEEALVQVTGPGPQLFFAGAVSDLPEGWQACDLVIEAVPEVLEIKQAALAALEAWLPTTTLIASNTSGLTTSSLCEKIRHPERLAIAHFFNPADVIPVVELVASPTMAAPRLQELADLLAASGKIPAILHREVPCFVANRIQHAMMREAFHLVEEGVADPETIDQIVRWTIGVRLAFFGPFEQRDLNGLDTHLSIASYLYPFLSAATEPFQQLRDKVAAGACGRKSGEGFYRWDEDRLARQARSEEALTRLIEE